MRVSILIAHGFTDSGLSVVLDVFRTANALGRRASGTTPFQVSVVAARRQVRAASGLRVGPAASLSSASRAELLLVPGYWVEAPREMDDLLGRADVKKLVGAIRAAHARGSTVGSSCGGAFLLAEAGLLDGRSATTTWWLAPHLQARCPGTRIEPDKALVIERRVVTAGAVFAAADLALHFVARARGPTLARRVARLLLLETHASQGAFMAIQQLSTNDETVRRAETWVRAHLGASFSVRDMAHAAGTSPRTLARRLAGAVGTTPIGFVQRLRVEQAAHLIETTSLSLGEVSERVGYGDANALRRMMRRHLQATPRELRRRQQAT